MLGETISFPGIIFLSILSLAHPAIEAKIKLTIADLLYIEFSTA